MGNDSRQHGFEVERGADGLTNFAQCLELTDRARQFLCPRLQFLKQSDIFYGDHRLVSESFEKRDLLLRKRLDYHATNNDHADRLVLAHQGRGEQSSDAKTL